MNYVSIKNYDIANGTGIRVSLFVSGCRHKCDGCFNTEAWSFNYGKTFDNNVFSELLEMLSANYIKGLSLLGGEPFENENAKVLIPYIKKIREIMPEKDIWAYSGYTYEELINDEIKKELLELTDVLVDGKFILELKDPSLSFRGSSNQRIIDVKKSLKKNEVICHFKMKEELNNERKRI